MYHIKFFFIKVICVHMHTVSFNHIQKDLLIRDFIFIAFASFNNIFSQFFLNEFRSE